MLTKYLLQDKYILDVLTTVSSIIHKTESQTVQMNHHVDTQLTQKDIYGTGLC